MIINPQEIAHQERYKLLIGSVLPRPIAWVSSCDKEGKLNLAPFSYFTAVCASPLTLVFCPGVHPEGDKKDTWQNIEQVPEFVINITNEETVAAMNRSATILRRGLNEFEWAGVTMAPSSTISVPRVAEAPVAFECRLRQIVVVSDKPGGGAAIFGEVTAIYIRDDLYGERGQVLLERLKPIGRLAGAAYTRVNDIFEMKRLPAPEGSERYT